MIENIKSIVDADLEQFHFRWLEIKGIGCRFPYLDNAIFQPSKMKFVLRE